MNNKKINLFEDNLCQTAAVDFDPDKKYNVKILTYCLSSNTFYGCLGLVHNDSRLYCKYNEKLERFQVSKCPLDSVSIQHTQCDKVDNVNKKHCENFCYDQNKQYIYDQETLECSCGNCQNGNHIDKLNNVCVTSQKNFEYYQQQCNGTIDKHGKCTQCMPQEIEILNRCNQLFSFNACYFFAKQSTNLYCKEVAADIYEPSYCKYPKSGYKQCYDEQVQFCQNQCKSVQMMCNLQELKCEACPQNFILDKTQLKCEQLYMQYNYLYLMINSIVAGTLLIILLVVAFLCKHCIGLSSRNQQKENKQKREKYNQMEYKNMEKKIQEQQKQFHILPAFENNNFKNNLNVFSAKKNLCRKHKNKTKIMKQLNIQEQFSIKDNTKYQNEQFQKPMIKEPIKYSLPKPQIFIRDSQHDPSIESHMLNNQQPNMQTQIQNPFCSNFLSSSKKENVAQNQYDIFSGLNINQFGLQGQLQEEYSKYSDSYKSQEQSQTQ